MRALVYTGIEALEMRDVAVPVPAKGEVVVDVESVGICGSDMHAFLGHDDRRPAPLILGHEVAGLAAGLDRARVTLNPLVTCGTCPACLEGRDNICPNRQIISLPPREGGFAEAVAIPERNCVLVPDHVTPDQAALTEPIACGWHAGQIAQAHPAWGDGPSVLVLGGGAIGVGAALSLAAQGAREVLLAEPNALRRDYLNKNTEIRSVPTDHPDAAGPFDVVVDGVGIPPTRAQACAAVRPGGIIVHIGLGHGEGGLDTRRMTLQEITFTGTYTYTSQDFRDTAQAMFDGRLGPLDWVETRPLSDGAAAFADIRAGRVAAPKIILKPDV